MGFRMVMWRISGMYVSKVRRKYESGDGNGRVELQLCSYHYCLAATSVTTFTLNHEGRSTLCQAKNTTQCAPPPVARLSNSSDDRFYPGVPRPVLL